MSAGAFYTAVLAAAATLMGLLFFAVLFNMQQHGQHKLGPHWLSLARSTTNVYVVLMLCPLVFLLPDLAETARSGLLLTLAAFSVGRQYICWSAAWRLKNERSAQVLWRLGWLLLAPSAAFVLVGWDSTAPFRSPGNVDYAHVPLALLFLFIVAVRNSCNLVMQHSGLVQYPQTGEVEGCHDQNVTQPGSSPHSKTVQSRLACRHRDAISAGS